MDRVSEDAPARWELDPADAGIQPLRFDAAMEVNAETVAALGGEALEGLAGPAAEQIAWTAGSLLHWAGTASSLIGGVEAARQAMVSGDARAVLRTGLEWGA